VVRVWIIKTTAFRLKYIQMEKALKLENVENNNFEIRILSKNWSESLEEVM
jgi:hypothetical protein